MLLGSIHRPSVPAKTCTPQCRLRSLLPPIRALPVRGEVHLLVRQPVTGWLLQSLERPRLDLHTATRRTATVRVHSIRTEMILFPAHLPRQMAPFLRHGLHQVSRTPRRIVLASLSIHEMLTVPTHKQLGRRPHPSRRRRAIVFLLGVRLIRRRPTVTCSQHYTGWNLHQRTAVSHRTISSQGQTVSFSALCVHIPVLFPSFSLSSKRTHSFVRAAMRQSRHRNHSSRKPTHLQSPATRTAARTLATDSAPILNRKRRFLLAATSPPNRHFSLPRIGDSLMLLCHRHLRNHLFRFLTPHLNQLLLLIILDPRLTPSRCL